MRQNRSTISAPPSLSPSPICPVPSPAETPPAATHPSSPPTSPARQGRATASYNVLAVTSTLCACLPPFGGPARRILGRATPSKSCIVTRQDRMAINAKYHIRLFFATVQLRHKARSKKCHSERSEVTGFSPHTALVSPVAKGGISVRHQRLSESDREAKKSSSRVRWLRNFSINHK